MKYFKHNIPHPTAPLVSISRTLSLILTCLVHYMLQVRFPFDIFNTVHKLQLPEICPGSLRLKLNFSACLLIHLLHVYLMVFFFATCVDNACRKVVFVMHSLSINLEWFMEYCFTKITVITAEGMWSSIFSACWDEPEITRMMFTKRLIMLWRTF